MYLYLNNVYIYKHKFENLHQCIHEQKNIHIYTHINHFISLWHPRGIPQPQIMSPEDMEQMINFVKWKPCVEIHMTHLDPELYLSSELRPAIHDGA